MRPDVSDAIRTTSCVTDLDLSHCELTDKSFSPLTDILKVRCRLSWCECPGICLTDGRTVLDPALQQHNAVRDELRWACSLRNDPLNVSVCGLLYVDMSSNRISDEGAAAFAQYLFHDNWLQGEKRLHRGAACSLARRGVSHIHARTHTCCCAALNLQNNELGEEGIVALLEGIASHDALFVIDVRNNPMACTLCCAIVAALALRRG